MCSFGKPWNFKMCILTDGTYKFGWIRFGFLFLTIITIVTNYPEDNDCILSFRPTKNCAEYALYELDILMINW